MAGLRGFACGGIAGVAVVVAGGCTDDGDGFADCVAQLLAAASTDTDNLPSIDVPRAEFAEQFAASIGDVAEVRCAVIDRTAAITYIGADVDAGAKLAGFGAGDVAIGDGVVIIEPGGDAASRLEDPGDTWADVDGATEMIERAFGGDLDVVELSLPDPDDSAVHLVASAHESTVPARGEVRWRFADEAAADQHLDAVVAALADEGFETAGQVEVDGRDVVAKTDRLGGLSPGAITLSD